MASIDSLRIELYSYDYAIRSGLPSGGLLISGWSKIPDPGSYPKAHDNLTYFMLSHNSGPEDITADWTVVNVVSQGGVTASGQPAYFTSNLMMWGCGMRLGSGTYINDYCLNHDVAPTEAEFYGWVWNAMQIIPGASQFTMRHWIKFGRDGTPYKATADNVISVATMRSDLISNGRSSGEVNAWTPADHASELIIGYDADYTDYDLTHHKIDQLSTEPSIGDLNTIALATAEGDSSAWAHWRFNWAGSSANLVDISGNSRTLSSSDTFAQGDSFDEGSAGGLAIPVIMSHRRMQGVS